MGAPDFGDIPGLHALATALRKAAPEVSTSAHVLNTQVNDLTKDAWTGSAAQAFGAAWQKDATDAQAISGSLSHIGGTVSQLASALEEAKKQYDNAAQTAKEQDVPLLAPGEQTVLPADKIAKAEQLSAQANSAVRMADVARKEASAALEPLMSALDPSAKIGPMTPQEAAELEKMGLGDYVKIGAAAADLYASPAIATTIQAARVAKLEKQYVAAKAAYSAAGGKSAPRSLYQELRAAKKDALTKLKAARGEEATAEALADKFPGSRAAATDLEKTLDTFGADASDLKIIKAAPLVDVLATGYSVYDDVHNRGWSPAHAIVADSVDTLAGVGAAAGLVALAPEAAPAIVVAGAGAAVAFEATEGVTALTHDAHWGANIQQYGVVDGVGHSFADAGSAFAKDNVDTAKKVWHTVSGAASSVWHSVF
ncbi:MAG TPA: WXG100 family type VII secretion target [Pseudonocardiaceae bacterium]|nr:WXG100 family type VII secretion target [Pseudonocardiaceae bacterium]